MSAALHENGRMLAQIRDLQDQIAAAQRERTTGDIEEMQAAQLRADAVGALFGERVPSPTVNDDVVSYRRRLLTKFQRHSPRYKDAQISRYDPAAVASAEEVIYADAVKAARNGAAEKPGVMVAHKHRDASGREITEWHGDPMAWMQHFMAPGVVGSVIDPRRR